MVHWMLYREVGTSHSCTQLKKTPISSTGNIMSLNCTLFPHWMCETIYILLPTLNLIFPWGRNTVRYLGLWKHSNYSLLCKKCKTLNLSLIHLHARDHVPHQPFRSVLRPSWGSHQLSDLEYGKISSSPICKLLCDEELILLPCLF